MGVASSDRLAQMTPCSFRIDENTVSVPTTGAIVRE